MVDKLDFNDINSMIKEYFKFQGLESSLDCFMAEERTKYYANKNSKNH
jgi:hypothetical protein